MTNIIQFKKQSSPSKIKFVKSIYQFSFKKGVCNLDIFEFKNRNIVVITETGINPGFGIAISRPWVLKTIKSKLGLDFKNSVFIEHFNINSYKYINSFKSSFDLMLEKNNKIKLKRLNKDSFLIKSLLNFKERTFISE
jgi:hypothetical protein